MKDLELYYIDRLFDIAGRKNNTLLERKN